MDLIEKAKAAQGALERTFAGLPGIKGYKEKELRRCLLYTSTFAL